ncbi:MAG TPA: serine/threonine protein kinase [Pyrinomonadaceae bacterium]|nr:serine/threonine protein kinase [Pyrinomonadaceae bacterium]
MRELSLDNCRIDQRYEIRETLGRGSYAEIFVATDGIASPSSPHKKVVIKALNVFLQDELDADLERTLVENFQNEAIALDRVRHPNIISRLGHGTARDLKGTIFHYLVLEYLSGGDLQNVVRRRPIDLSQLARYIEQICAGLSHAHRSGVIHRDIKPQNLLLTADLSTVKIADFGVARFSMADSPITRVGTNAYAPPEHSPLTAGNFAAAKLTPAADVYSLAKTIYTLVSRESPRSFAGRSIDELPVDIRYEPWATSLLKVLTKATADVPEHRHQSIEEFWLALEPFIVQIGDAEPETIIQRFDSPQPHVTRGYSPVTPSKPQFEIDLVTGAGRKIESKTVSIPISPQPISYQPPVVSPLIRSGKTAAEPVRVQVEKPKRSFVRRAAMFGIFVLVFTGLLFGTATYFRGRYNIPTISNPFSAQTATANENVNLRSGPSADTDRIGLVTKNSKVRIVKSQNNWYQVDVISQGIARNDTGSVSRGWLNGKFLDIDNN